MEIITGLTPYADGALETTAYVSGDQNPVELYKKFDCEITIKFLKEAIKEIENGNGLAANDLITKAFVRSSLFFGKISTNDIDFSQDLSFAQSLLDLKK